MFGIGILGVSCDFGFSGSSGWLGLAGFYVGFLAFCDALGFCGFWLIMLCFVVCCSWCLTFGCGMVGGFGWCGLEVGFVDLSLTWFFFVCGL